MKATCVAELYLASFLALSDGLTEWSEWTCCRQIVNLQSRERIITAPRIETEYRKCTSLYCLSHQCKDTQSICQQLMSTLGSVCSPSNSMSTFMSHHCPLMCGYCESSTRPASPIAVTTRRPWQPQSTVMAATTRMPWQRQTTARMTTSTGSPRKPLTNQAINTATISPQNMLTARQPVAARTPPSPTLVPTTTRLLWLSRPTPLTAPPATSVQTTIRTEPALVKVTILTRNGRDRRQSHQLYKFVAGGTTQIAPWRRIPKGGPELSHFYLYSKPIGGFTLPLTFCSAKYVKSYIRKYSLKTLKCESPWSQEFVLYGSQNKVIGSKIYYVGNSGEPYYASRIFAKFPSKGYDNGLFHFYGPKVTVPGTPPKRRFFPNVQGHF